MRCSFQQCQSQTQQYKDVMCESVTAAGEEREDKPLCTAESTAEAAVVVACSEGYVLQVTCPLHDGQIQPRACMCSDTFDVFEKACQSSLTLSKYS